MKYIIIILFFFWVGNISFARGNKIDSLSNLLKTAQTDTLKVNLMNQLGREYWSINPEKTISYSSQALALSEKINFSNGRINALNVLSAAFWLQGTYPKSIALAMQALQNAQKYNYQQGIADSYNVLGLNYKGQKEYEKSLNYHIKALTVQQKIQDLQGIAYSYINIGNVFYNQKKYLESSKYFYEGLKAQRAINNARGIAFSLNSIGWNYSELDSCNKAITFFKEALANGQASKNQVGMAYSYRGLAKCYNALNQNKEAIESAKLGLEIAKNLKQKAEIKNLAEALAQSYEKQKDYVQALSYFKLAEIYEDSLFNDEEAKKIGRLEVQHELDKKNTENTLLKTEKELQKTLIQRQMAVVIAISVLAFAVVAVAFNLYFSNKKRKETNQKLRAQNEAIGKQKQQLEVLSEVKNKVLSIVSHDFRSPLNSIRVVLPMLQNGEFMPEEIPNVYNQLLNSAENASILLENLLAWARNQMQGIKMHPKQISINELIEETINLSFQQVKDKNIVLTNALTERFVAFADEDTVKLVLRNLVANAIKFTSAHGSIHFAAKKVDNFIHIAVKDTGRGMTAEYQKKIIRTDAQNSSLGTVGEKGTGLGLVVSQDFIAKNGGEMWIESEVGKGSTFTFSVPIAEDN